MPITATTTLPDAANVQRSNTVEDEITITYNDTINYRWYRTEWKDADKTTWNAALTGRTVRTAANATTNWSSGTNATVSTTGSPSEDGTAIKAVTDSAATQGSRTATFTPGTNDDLSTDDYLQFWYYTDNTAGTHALTLTDGAGTSETVSFAGQLSANTVITVQISLSSYTTVNLANIDTYTWDFAGDGTGINKTIHVDSVISGVDVVGQNTTSVTIPYLEDGTDYNARVRTETEHKIGAWQPTSTGLTTTTQLPAATTVSLDTTIEDEITITWTRNDDNPDGNFEIFRSTDGTLGTSVGTVAPTTQTFTDTALADGETYYYTVRRNTPDRYADSTQVSGTTVLPAPTGATASVTANDSIDVSWTDNSDNEDNFRVQVSRDGAAYTNVASGATVTANTTVLTATPNSDKAYDAQIGIDSSFKFRVRAETEDANSSWATTGTVYTDPVPPHTPSVNRPGDDTVEITATQHSDIGDRIVVEYREDTGAGYGAWQWFDTWHGGETHVTGDPTVKGNTVTATYTVGTAYQSGDTLKSDARHQFRLYAYSPDSRRSQRVYTDYGNKGNLYFEDGFDQPYDGQVDEFQSNTMPYSGSYGLTKDADSAQRGMARSDWTLDNTTAITASVWVNRHSMNARGGVYLADGTGAGYVGYYDPGNELRIYTASSYTTLGTKIASVAVSALADGWYKVVLERTSTGDFTVHMEDTTGTTVVGPTTAVTDTTYSPTTAGVWAYDSEIQYDLLEASDGAGTSVADDFETFGLARWDAYDVSDVNSGITGGGQDGEGDMGISGPDQGTHYINLQSNDYIQKNLGDLSSETHVIVKCALAAGSMDNGNERVGIQWSPDGGTSWTDYDKLHWEYNRQGWVEVTARINGSDLGTNCVVRFDGWGGSGDYLGVDRVIVSDILHEYTTPAAPSGLGLDTSVEDEITATWTNNHTFGDYHNAYHRRSSDTTYTKSSGISETATSYTFTGLDDGEEYDTIIRIRVQQDRNGSTVTTYRSDATATATTVLPAPTNVAISNVGYYSFDVSWTDNSDNEDNFEVRLSTDGSTYTTNTTVTANTTAATASGLTEGEKYWVQVRAVTEDTTTDSSAVTQITDLHKPTVSTDYDTNYNINLTIGNLGDTATGSMSIYRSKIKGQKGTAIATNLAPSTSYTDDTVTAGVTYYYTVQRNGSDTTVDSDQVHGILPDSWQIDGTALGTIKDETLDWEALGFSTVTDKDKLGAILNAVQDNAEKLHRVVDSNGKPEAYDTSATASGNTYTFTPPQGRSDFYQETQWLIDGYDRSIHDNRGQRYESNIEAVRKTNYSEAQATGSNVTWFKYLDRCDATTNFTGVDLSLSTVSDPSDDGTAIKGVQDSANPASHENDFTWSPGTTYSLSGTFYFAIYPEYATVSNMDIQFRDSNGNTYEGSVEALSGQTLTTGEWNYVSIDTSQITTNSTVDISLIDRILIRLRGMTQDEYAVLDSMGTYDYTSPTGDAVPKATVLNRKFYFDFFSGDFVTKDVHEQVGSGTADSVDTKEITVNVNATEANYIRGSCSHLGAVNTRVVPDGVNLAEDNSPNSRNTVDVTSPGKYGEDVLTSGTYVVASWEITNLNDTTYEVSLELLKAA